MRRRRIYGTIVGESEVTEGDLELLLRRKKLRKLWAIIAMYVPMGLSIVNILSYYTLSPGESGVAFKQIFMGAVCVICFWILIYRLPNRKLFRDIRDGNKLVSRAPIAHMERIVDGDDPAVFSFETEDGFSFMMADEDDFDDIKEDGAVYLHYAFNTRILLGMHIERSSKYFNLTNQ